MYRQREDWFEFVALRGILRGDVTQGSGRSGDVNYCCGTEELEIDLAAFLRFARKNIERASIERTLDIVA